MIKGKWRKIYRCKCGKVYIRWKNLKKPCGKCGNLRLLHSMGLVGRWTIKGWEVKENKYDIREKETPFDKNIRKYEAVLNFLKGCNPINQCNDCFYKMQCSDLFGDTDNFLTALMLHKYKRVEKIIEG